MIEPTWLPLRAVIDANEALVAETGEPFLLRDKGLLESALDKPRNRFLYDGVDDIVDLAAALLFGIAQNHPFLQGNKRTAFASAVMFLELNGYRLSNQYDDRLGQLIVDTLEAGDDLYLAAQLRFFAEPIEAQEP